MTSMGLPHHAAGEHLRVVLKWLLGCCRRLTALRMPHRNSGSMKGSRWRLNSRLPSACASGGSCRHIVSCGQQRSILICIEDLFRVQYQCMQILQERVCSTACTCIAMRHGLIGGPSARVNTTELLSGPFSTAQQRPEHAWCGCWMQHPWPRRGQGARLACR